jgi:hypothetical protein
MQRSRSFKAKVLTLNVERWFKTFKLLRIESCKNSFSRGFSQMTIERH